MRYWKRLNPDGSTRTVESYSHEQQIEGEIEITGAEFKAFLNSLTPPPPTDWKSLWLAADTVNKKLTVLAKRLGMEN